MECGYVFNSFFFGYLFWPWPIRYLKSWWFCVSGKLLCFMGKKDSMATLSLPCWGYGIRSLGWGFFTFGGRVLSSDMFVTLVSLACPARWEVRRGPRSTHGEFQSPYGRMGAKQKGVVCTEVIAMACSSKRSKTGARCTAPNICRKQLRRFSNGCQQLGIYFSVLKHWNMVILIPNYGRYSQTNENFQMIF